jgi:Tfp pilus assembly protein PilF
MLGAWLMAKREYAAGEREYLKAMQLFPSDPFVPYNLGQEYFHAGLYEQAYRMYERAERIMPNFQDAQGQMALARAMQGRYAEARQLAVRAMSRGVGDARTLRAILTASSVDEKARARMVSVIDKRQKAVVAR